MSLRGSTRTPITVLVEGLWPKRRFTNNSACNSANCSLASKPAIKESLANVSALEKSTSFMARTKSVRACSQRFKLSPERVGSKSCHSSLLTMYCLMRCRANSRKSRYGSSRCFSKHVCNISRPIPPASTSTHNAVAVGSAGSQRMAPLFHFSSPATGKSSRPSKCAP